MKTLIAPRYRMRFLLAALIVSVLAWQFWTGSRYPSLNEKAMMSGAIQLEDALSFEAHYAITAEMRLHERIFWSTLNWIHTNRNGMTFGVLFGAAFLTALSYLRMKSFRSGFANSLLGMVIGAPLGVCVNCAAPIARGMYTGGLRAETTLSAMIASPTLNIVVLTMAFSIMPFYMAATKLAFSLLIILAAVPVICRFLPQTQISTPEPERWPVPDDAAQESLVQAVLGFAWSFARNLWYIVRMTVPLMLLAGFLGTVAAILLPVDGMIGMEFSMFALLALVAVGVFLPCPMGFDVVLAGALLATGLDQGYAMALLFTLGSFSVYSFMIVTQSLGKRAGWLMAGAVALGGMISGLGVHTYHNWQSDRALELLLGAKAPIRMWGAAFADTVDLPGAPQVSSPDAAHISVQVSPFAQQSTPQEAPFTRQEATAFGIDKPLEFSFRDMWPPFWEGRSLAAADIDRDGDLDLAIASTEETLYLYQNDGSGNFSRLRPDLGPLAGLMTFNAAFADIDNDGWPDLFLTSYGKGNYLWRNVNGRFGSVPAQPVANNPDTPLTLALAMADADRDGDLDIALGNWAAGWYRRIPGEEARNRIVWNQSGVLTGQEFTELPGIPGETLTMLFTDMDGNGTTDLIEGNDFDVPDYFHLNDGSGGFRAITHADGLIPHTTTTTMAIASGDLTGDGVLEIYLAQIAGRSSGVSKKLKMLPIESYCDSIVNPDALATCRKNMEIKRWYRSGNNFDPTYAENCQKLTGRYQDECKAMLVKDLAIQRRDPSICALIPAAQEVPRAFCDIHFRPARAFTQAEAEASLPQILRSNVLLQWDGVAFQDKATDMGLEVGGWSWDSKMGDYDNDGDLDVYVVNGTWVPNEVTPSNLFYQNDGTGHFTEASGPFGLEDYLMTAAALQFDMDGDGDLDVLTHTVNGPLVMFRNNSQSKALTVTLTDMAGNRDGIGAFLKLTGTDGKIQVQEMRLGGGFMSFDPPVAHFGLGQAAGAQSLSIRWADGSVTEIEGPLAAGNRYHITRQP